jgi:TatD DNase family protein
MPEPLVDIGANLTDKAFREDHNDVIARAQAVGVERIVLTGTSVGGSHTAAELAHTMPGVLYSTAGVHPHDAKSCDDETIPTLRELAARPQVVAIGECGLDFNRDFSPRPVQREWFAAQVDLAIELSMPLFLHERDACDALLDVLRPRRDRIRAAVVHCFTGTREQLRAYLDLDLHIGITGWICDERRGHHLHDLVGEIPGDRLMIETDAPYLLPRTIRPKPKSRRNEPSYLPYVVDTIASCLGKTPGEVASSTTAVAAKFFGLD